MNIQEAMLLISLKKKNIFSISDLARSLSLSRQYLQKYKEKDLTQEQIAALEKAYDVNLSYSLNIADAVEIKYIECTGIDKEIYKNPLITTLWLDKELVKRIWHKESKNLRFLQMPGDTMDGGENPIKSGDLLLVDITEKQPFKSGLYVYTVQVHTTKILFVNYIEVKPDGSFMFIFNNPHYENSVFPFEHVKSSNLQIMGRVIKNISSLA